MNETLSLDQLWNYYKYSWSKDSKLNDITKSE